MNAQKLPQGDVALVHEPAAQKLLASAIPARMAYVAADGSPRVLPTWFHWTGEELVMATYLQGARAGVRHAAHRLSALRRNPRVAVTIDTEGFPPTGLSMRGDVLISEVDGLAPEYVEAAKRYLGREAAAAMVKEVDGPGTRQARLVLRPSWVGLVDFQRRMPSAQGGIA